MNTVKFTFTQEYALSGDVIDYYCDYDDDTNQLNVYVDDVDDTLISSMTDEQLCEFFGLETEYLVYSNRTDYL